MSLPWHEFRQESARVAAAAAEAQHSRRRLAGTLDALARRLAALAASPETPVVCLAAGLLVRPAPGRRRISRVVSALLYGRWLLGGIL